MITHNEVMDAFKENPKESGYELEATASNFRDLQQVVQDDVKYIADTKYEKCPCCGNNKAVVKYYAIMLSRVG